MPCIQVQQKIGYCPQFDALIESMTAREILTMFAHIRGVHTRQIKKTVDELLHHLMLEKYADKIVETYRYVSVISSFFLSTSVFKRKKFTLTCLCVYGSLSEFTGFMLSYKRQSSDRERKLFEK